MEAGALAALGRDSGGGGDRLAIHGVELRYRRRGDGPAVLCIHETAATGEIWRSLAEALPEAAVIAYDRRGWGESSAPDPYLRTTIEEQSEDAAALLEHLGLDAKVVCGAGLGAVVALDLVLRHPELARAALLIEPPLLAFVADATEGLSADAARIQAAVADGGPGAALDVYLRGELPSIGAGADRLPGEIAARARSSPLSLFAELSAVPAWSVDRAALREASVPSRIITSASSPVLLQRAGEQLAVRLGSAELRRLRAEGLPHVEGAGELAGVVRELFAAAP